MVDGEECQLKPIGDADLVIDAAEVVLDHLLLGAELSGDLLVLAALRDEGDDLQFLGREALEDAGADAVGRGHGLDRGALDRTLAGGYAVETLNQLCGRDGAKHDAFHALSDRGVERGIVREDDDGAAASLLDPIQQCTEVTGDAGGEDDDGLAKAADRFLQPLEVRALGGDADTFFEGLYASHAGAEDDLVVGEDDLQGQAGRLRTYIAYRTNGREIPRCRLRRRATFPKRMR